MPQIVGVHGIAQQYRSGPELTRTWVDALRGGLEVAGFRTTADALGDTAVRVSFFGELFRPNGAKAGGDVPYTASDVTPGPERELLESWYEAAIQQEPTLRPTPGAKGPGRTGTQAMLDRLFRSRTLAGV